MLAAVADNFVALAFDEAVGAFKDVLQGTGLVHRQRERTRKNSSTRNRNTRSSMATALVMGAWGYCGIECGAPQQSRDRAGEEVVQDFGKPELFRHESGF